MAYFSTVEVLIPVSTQNLGLLNELEIARLLAVATFFSHTSLMNVMSSLFLIWKNYISSLIMLSAA